MVTLDIDQAIDASRPALGLWLQARKHPEQPAFTGGVLDAWPGWAVDAIAVCRDEEAAIRFYLMHMEG